MDKAANGPECSSRKRARRRFRLHLVIKGMGMNYVLVRPITLPLPSACSFYAATKIAFEWPTLCCCNGEVKLAPIESSGIVDWLFSIDDDLGEHFRNYSRVYNNFFAFTSLGGRMETITDKGIHTFELQGQLYHYLPTLFPCDGAPNFLQIYFYDGSLEMDVLCRYFEDLRPEIKAYLMTAMNDNPYASFFRSLHASEVTEMSNI